MRPVGAASVKRRAVGELLISRSFGIGGDGLAHLRQVRSVPDPVLILPTRGDWVWGARPLPQGQLPSGLDFN